MNVLLCKIQIREVYQRKNFLELGIYFMYELWNNSVGNSVYGEYHLQDEREILILSVSNITKSHIKLRRCSFTAGINGRIGPITDLLAGNSNRQK
jgi:hypothetical protein